MDSGPTPASPIQAIREFLLQLDRCESYDNTYPFKSAKGGALVLRPSEAMAFGEVNRTWHEGKDRIVQRVMATATKLIEIARLCGSDPTPFLLLDVTSAFLRGEARRAAVELAKQPVISSAVIDPEQTVRDYIIARRSEGMPIQKITRDGIARGLRAKGTPVSAGKVSETQAWAALQAEKRQSRAADIKRADTVSSNAEDAIERGDWDAVQKEQEKEEKAPRRKHK